MLRTERIRSLPPSAAAAWLITSIAPVWPNALPAAAASASHKEIRMFSSPRGKYNREPRLLFAVFLPPMAQPVEVEIDHRSRIESEHLAHDQTANNRNSQGAAQLGSGTAAQGQRQSAQHRGHGGHQDRTQTQQARFIDGIA